MITCTKRLEFDAAHRVLGHGGRCRFLHGHRYAAEITVRAPALDGLGMVADFGVIKERVGKWIDDNLDHNIILHQDDPLLAAVEEVLGNKSLIGEEAAQGVLAGRAPLVMPCNPTAENLAVKLYFVARTLLPESLTVRRVRVYETPTCWADYLNE